MLKKFLIFFLVTLYIILPNTVLAVSDLTVSGTNWASGAGDGTYTYQGSNECALYWKKTGDVDGDYYVWYNISNNGAWYLAKEANNTGVLNCNAPASANYYMYPEDGDGASTTDYPNTYFGYTGGAFNGDTAVVAIAGSGVPEFSTYIYLTTIMAGSWFIFQKYNKEKHAQIN